MVRGGWCCGRKGCRVEEYGEGERRRAAERDTSAPARPRRRKSLPASAFANSAPNNIIGSQNSHPRQHRSSNSTQKRPRTISLTPLPFLEDYPHKSTTMSSSSASTTLADIKARAADVTRLEKDFWKEMAERQRPRIAAWIEAVASSHTSIEFVSYHMPPANPQSFPLSYKSTLMLPQYQAAAARLSGHQGQVCASKKRGDQTIPPEEVREQEIPTHGEKQMSITGKEDPFEFQALFSEGEGTRYLVMKHTNAII